MTPVIPDLTCQELVELVTEYLEGRLSPDDRTRFELHLAFCEPCVAYVRQMRQILEATGKLGEESVSPQGREHLLAAFRGWKGTGGGGS